MRRACKFCGSDDVDKRNQIIHYEECPKARR